MIPSKKKKKKNRSKSRKAEHQKKEEEAHTRGSSQGPLPSRHQEGHW
jgi:hypothetical protein